MDRWLCAALVGYSLSFSFTKQWLLQPWLLYALSALLLVGVPIVVWCRRHQRIGLLLIGCILCGIGWGAGNGYLHLTRQIPPHLFGQTHDLVMTIDAITQQQANFWRIEGRLQTLNGESLPSSPRLRLNWYNPPHQALRAPQAGTLWQFTARLKAPQGVRNDGGFLYHRYLVSQNIQALGSIRSGAYLSGDIAWRQHIYNRFAPLRGQLDQFGVLLALTLGERQALTTEQWLLYQRTGLAHLIAISGLHLSLVAGGVLFLSRYVTRFAARSRKRRDRLNVWPLGIAIALICAFAYAALAGFATATLRAFAMFAVVILHKRYALHTPMTRVLLRTVALVILVEPLAFLQPGFWLSVVAVATIMLMHWRWPLIAGRWRAVRALWRLELVLTLLMWPLTAGLFGGLPMLAPLTNLFVVPVVAMWVLPLSLLALLVLILGDTSLALALFQLAERPLSMFEPVLTTIAQAPWQWLDSQRSGPIALLVVLVLVWCWPWHWRWKILFTLAYLLLLLVLQQLHLRERAMVVHVLDVDQGSAIVIQRGHQALLIDTGANWELGGNMAERVILPFLRYHQLQPQMAFVSHTDNDHAGGVAVIQQAFPNIRWFGSGVGAPCVAGQQGQWYQLHWQVLHPRKAGTNRMNDDSCVLMLTIHDTRILVPGDISYRAERQILSHAMPVQADVLVLAHHGSNSSSEDYFLQAVKPEVAVASRGRNNAYGMVAEAVKQRLIQHRIQLYDTAEGGQISIHVDHQGYRLRQPWAATGRPWFDADN